MSEQIGTQLIYKAIPKIMKEVGVIGKTGYNSFDKYKFRSIEDIYNALQPVLANNGVFIIPRLLKSIETTIQAASGKDQIRIKLTVEYKICCEDGSFVEAIFEGEGIDRSDKATNKAFQAAFKYMCSQLFCLAFADMEDADRESPEYGKEKKPAQVQQKEKDVQQSASNSKPVQEPKPVVNHAAINTNNTLAFNFGTYKSGTSFEQIGVVKMRELRTGIMSYSLKKESSGEKVPQAVTEFIEASKGWIEQQEKKGV